MDRRTATAAAAGGASTLLAAGLFRAWRSPQRRFAGMAGSTIAAPDAAGWVTDFLNAAYYRRPPEDRELDDLRLAFAILTTRWHRLGHRRLRAPDALAFHTAFGRDRFLETGRSPRGTLDGEQLRAGAERLIGSWFPAAYADGGRRAYGIAFRDAEERAGYRPEVRLRTAKLGDLTPPAADPARQTWHTYPPVRVPSSAGVIAALSATETWPDYASAVGRFTPLRSGPLAGQTFEIEVAAGTAGGRPIFTRGYVTITRVVSEERPHELRTYVDELNEGLASYGRDEPAAVPAGATPILAFDLTTHESHFMGRGRNRLVLFEEDGRALVRAAGTWDPMPWHIERAYARAGAVAQHAFWGEGADIERSMLHQIASAVPSP